MKINLKILKIKNKIIIHQITFSAIGGIQNSFIPFYKLSKLKSDFKHKIYGMHPIDPYFKEIKKYYVNFNKSLIAKIKFIYFIFSKKYIIHFYNTLSSNKIKFLLKFVPSNKIIFHERGTSWSAKKDDFKTIRSNAKKADIIIANSNASKILLNKRFNIDNHKIKVIHNGFLSKKFKSFNISRFSNKFSVGYIGRLDTPKGVHVLVEAAKNLSDIDFFIAGDGILEKKLTLMSKGYDNIKFIGRAKPLDFILKMDLMVFPSIREPLGNVIIESGFCKKAVIASNIDGIPDIIDDGLNGLLLTPKNDLSLKDIPDNAVPIPDYVIDSKRKKLLKPKEIDKNELIASINFLMKNKNARILMGENLHKKVKNDFSLEKYYSEIEKIYKIF